MLLVLVAVVLGVSAALIIITQNQTGLIEDAEAMTCSELLIEIQAEHPMSRGYVYVDTWIEKECWK